LQLWRARSELYGAGYDYPDHNFRNGQRNDDLRYDGGCAHRAGAVEPAFRARLAFGGRGDFPCGNFLFADGSESTALEIGSACGVAGRGCRGWDQLQWGRLRRWWGRDESWHDHGDLHLHGHGDAVKWNGADDGDHGQRAIGDHPLAVTAVSGQANHSSVDATTGESLSDFTEGKDGFLGALRASVHRERNDKNLFFSNYRASVIAGVVFV
jgi:hypothetical protein